VTLNPTSAPLSQAAAPRAPDIVMLDAAALAAAIRARQVSCRDVMGAYLDHIEKINPRVNAIVALQERKGLLANAEERDGELQRGDPVGPLHGFPFAVKDLSPVKGLPLTMGSPIFKNFIADTDSVMVERMRKAGAIFIGKTNTPELPHLQPDLWLDAQRLRSVAFGRRQQRRGRGRGGSAHAAGRGRQRLWRQPAQSGSLE
jgi:hypothetical protein